jgi:hypothetical protein
MRSSSHKAERRPSRGGAHTVGARTELLGEKAGRRAGWTACACRRDIGLSLKGQHRPPTKRQWGALDYDDTRGFFLFVCTVWLCKLCKIYTKIKTAILNDLADVISGSGHGTTDTVLRTVSVCVTGQLNCGRLSAGRETETRLCSAPVWL